MRDFTEIGYTLDSNDGLLEVSSEWDLFACRNQAPGLTKNAVVGHSLWDFISDEPTREIYRLVLAQVRNGMPRTFILRCDGPKCRRLIEMSFSLVPDGKVEIKIILLGVKSRPFQRLFSVTTPRSAKQIMVCSWCNHVQIRGDQWEEVEVAMQQLHLSKLTSLPQLHFVVCPHCFTKVMEIMAEHVAEPILAPVS